MKRTDDQPDEQLLRTGETGLDSTREVDDTSLRKKDLDALLSLAGFVKELKLPDYDSVPLEDRVVLDRDAGSI